MPSDAVREDQVKAKDYFNKWKALSQSQLENSKQSGVGPWLQDKSLALQKGLISLPMGIAERGGYGENSGRSERRNDAYAAALEAVKNKQPTPDAWKMLSY